VSVTLQNPEETGGWTLPLTSSDGRAVSTVDLVYFNAGGGHRSTALALESVLQLQKNRAWRVRMVNLFEVLDPKGRFKRVTGSVPEDWYNRRLARGWTLGMSHELRMLQAMIRLGHAAMVRRLQQHWLSTEPDMVVSLIPNFNRALHNSLVSTLPGVPYVTLLTDLADTPPRFWIEREQLQYFICGTPRAAEQALALGHEAHRVFRTSGMVLRPEFYKPPIASRATEMRRRGLDPDRPTGLVLFGGHGSQAMLGIARRLASTTQLILICGHNQKLADALRALPGDLPRLVVGFSSEIGLYMQLADFCIGKPGPGSVSEAVQMGLPVIVVDNAWTMPQERFNAHWIRDNGLGLVLPGFQGIRRAVADMVQHLEAFQANVRRMPNQALFEVPKMLDEILQTAEQATGPAGLLASPGFSRESG
jgi:hypothetical protein